MKKAVIPKNDGPLINHQTNHFFNGTFTIYKAANNKRKLIKIRIQETLILHSLIKIKDIQQRLELLPNASIQV